MEAPVLGSLPPTWGTQMKCQLLVFTWSAPAVGNWGLNQQLGDSPSFSPCPFVFQISKPE